MVDPVNNDINAPATPLANTAALPAFIRAMNRYMADHNDASAYTPLSPDDYTHEAFQANYALFIRSLQADFNDLNEDQNGWWNPNDTSSSFRAAWNRASPDAHDLDAEGRDILSSTGQLDLPTQVAFTRFLNLRAQRAGHGGDMTSYFNTQDARNHDGTLALRDAIRALFTAFPPHSPNADVAQPNDAAAPQQDDASPAEDSMPDNGDAPPASAFVYDETIDHNVPDARARIAHFQAAIGIEPTGHLNEQTQRALYQRLQTAGTPLPNGTLSHLSNQAILGDVDDALDALVQAERDAYEDAITQRQRTLLQAQGFSDQEVDTAVEALHAAPSDHSGHDRFKTMMAQHQRLKDDQDNANNLIETLWMLDLERRLWDGAVVGRLSPQDKSLFAAFDILNYIHTGDGMGNSLAAKAGPHGDEPYSDDWLFAPDIYESLRDQGAVDGTVLPAPHQRPGMIPREAVAEVARSLLKDRLREAGLWRDPDDQPNAAPFNLGEALLSGSFTLSFQDLELLEAVNTRPSLHEVLANEEYSRSLSISLQADLIDLSGTGNQGARDAMLYSADTIMEAVRNGDRQAFAILEDRYFKTPDAFLGTLPNTARARHFNAQYGSMADIGRVETVRYRENTDGDFVPQQVITTGPALMCDFVIHRRGSDYFETKYGMSAEEALQALTDFPYAQAPISSALREELDYQMDRVSIVDFFATNRERGVIDEFTPYADYQANRDHVTVQRVDIEAHQAYSSTPDTPHQETVSPATSPLPVMRPDF